MKTNYRFFATIVAVVASTLPAGAQYITTNRTIVGGNPFNTTINGSTVYFGQTMGGTLVPNLQADVIDPAQFGFNDQTGGGLRVFSNSIVRVQGGTFGVSGGTGAPGGGLRLSDTSQAAISGGTINILNINGGGAGASGAQATVSGGLIQNSNTQVVAVTNGILNLTGGTIRSTGAQSGITGNAGSVINIGSGTVESASGAAISISGDSTLTVSGGNVGVTAVNNVNVTASITGGTVSSLRAARNSAAFPDVQAVIRETASVTGGVFANTNAGIDIRGGTFGNYSSGASAAAFLALGTNTLNFYGTDLGLSNAVPGSVFFGNTYTGNFYTFTSGTFESGQSAVGLRIFDAVSLAGNTTNYTGGFTLNPVAAASAPEPGSVALIALAGAPVAGKVARRRRKKEPAEEPVTSCR